MSYIEPQLTSFSLDETERLRQEEIRKSEARISILETDMADLQDKLNSLLECLLTYESKPKEVSFWKRILGLK